MSDCCLSQLFEQMARRHRLADLFEIESQNLTEYVKVMLYDGGARVCEYVRSQNMHHINVSILAQIYQQ